MKIIKMVTMIFLILVLLLVGAFFVSPIANNMVLKSFASQLNSIEDPENSKVLEIKSICGKLTGNGNGMDFLACAVIESSMSLAELKEFYSKVEFKTAKKSKHNVSVEVTKALSNKLKSMYLEHGELVFDSINNNEFNNVYYLVISDGGYDASFDIRGH